MKDINGAFGKYFSLVCLILLAVILLYTLRDFIDAFLGAIIIYVMGRPLMRFLTEKLNWNMDLSATLVLILSFVIIFIPITIIFNLVFPKIHLFFSDKSLITQMFYKLDAVSQKYTGSKLLTEENINSIRRNTANYIGRIMGTTLSIITDLALTFFVAFYMFKNTHKTEDAIEKTLPISTDNFNKFSKELHDQTFSNVIGAPFLALTQGLVAWGGYSIFGIQEPLFWGLITGFFSFLPVFGSALIWFPAGIYQISMGETWQGIAIILFGITIISLVDNIFHFVLQKKLADVHPLVTVFGVIAGLLLFGITGIIFGPLLISYLIILFKIYREEYLT